MLPPQKFHTYHLIYSLLIGNLYIEKNGFLHAGKYFRRVKKTDAKMAPSFP